MQSPADGLWWAPRAWIGGRWEPSVLLHAGIDGRWAEVDIGQPAPAAAAQLPGPVLPGLVNAHSHAFQRAFLGLSERRDTAQDDFWSWRDRMYRVALRITPAQLRAVAAQLYRELLRGGYTHVCEFHYLHHQPDGSPYPHEAEMARALADAAQGAGIGLTLLPVLYERAGFEQSSLRPDQRRFATDTARVLRLRDAIRSWQLPGVDAGVAVHSLRAASAESITALSAAVADDPAPLHLHIAEQTAEIDACLAATGCRPIEWLCRHLRPDARWQLVHATHATPAEIDAVAATGAGVVLCPGTEANLGDGLCDLPRWLASGTPLSVGSDSHVLRDWPQELRWLEYGQRLLLRQRNVAADPTQQPATAARLFDKMLHGGAAAAGQTQAGLQPGARADLLLLDPQDPSLLGLPASHTLDATVFGSGPAPIAAVMVAGRWVHGDAMALSQPKVDADRIQRDFVAAMREMHDQA